jgi:hypothetical protein
MSIADRRARRLTSDAARAVLAVARGQAVAAVDWAQEHAPIFGRAAVRRRSRIVLAPYTRTYSLRGSLLKILTAPTLAIFCLIYGFFYALTAPTFIVAFVVPLLVMAALIIWALPHQRTAPTLLIEFLFPAFFIALILWPNYLAISLPGLPWITILRIIGLPMAGLLLVSLSVSPPFRKRVAESVRGIPLLWIFMCGFLLVQVATTIISTSPPQSAQLFFNQLIYWIAIFVISCALFRDLKFVERYWALLCCLAVAICVVVILESREQHVLWMSHIPAFLRIPDPSVQLILTPTFRPGINFYRAHATFATPLAMAEYLSLLTPFLLHFGFWSKNQVVKYASFAMIPLLFITIRLSDARLGIVGMLASLLLYGMLWSIVRWRSHPRDLFAAAAVYAYPAVFMAGIGAIFASTRLHAMAFGDGAQASSTAARQTQLVMAMAQLIKAPWGHGTGQAGPAMGYGEGAFITIDNYFITIALDYGILGLIFWYGMFIIGIFEAIRCSISSRYAGRAEARLLAPLAVSLTGFLVIKWVHGQDDNHSIFFMMLGMISALVYRLRQSDPSLQTAKGRAPIAWTQ